MIKKIHLDEILGPLVLAALIGKNAYDFQDYLKQYEINKSMTQIVSQEIDNNIELKICSNLNNIKSLSRLSRI